MERETVTMVYLGLAFDQRKHKLFQRLIEIDPLGSPNDGRELSWLETAERWYDAGRKSIMPAWALPGGVYRMEVGKEEDGHTVVFVNTITAVEQWKHKGQVAEWQTLSRSRRQAFEAQSEARQAVSRRQDLAALDPIREAYMAATPIQRPFILANAISYITRGVTTKRDD